MIDGSKLPLDENIALARRVVEMASGMSSRPCVEAELGKLGGKEDDLEVKPGEDLYTDPGEAGPFRPGNGNRLFSRSHWDRTWFLQGQARWPLSG